jgi:hypothetical protein
LLLFVPICPGVTTTRPQIESIRRTSSAFACLHVFVASAERHGVMKPRISLRVVGATNGRRRAARVEVRACAFSLLVPIWPCVQSTPQTETGGATQVLAEVRAVSSSCEPRGLA